jgi:hypothetical protein
MKLVLRAALAAALTLLVYPADAQWHGSIGPSARDVAHTEYNPAGKRLVRETGWLPGVALDAAYQTGNVNWIAAADWFQGSIRYQGQTQSGTAASSTTSTGLAALRAGAAYALGRDYFIVGALELDKWTRDIQGSGASAGLQEASRSTRLVTGAGRAWHCAAGTVAADAAVVFSGPERLRVGFSGMLDQASFDTRRGRGIRIGARIRPAFAPRLELSSRYDWIKVPRSADVAVARNGQFMGTVAQPEHERQALTFTVSALF